MLEYEIKRWDSIIPPGGTNPMPCIYIKPDEKFLNYLKAKNNTVSGIIRNTGSKYDRIAIVGAVDNSGYFPNYRPYFYNQTGYYVITLFAQWFGYPVKNGVFILETNEEQIQEQPPEIKAIEMYQTKTNCGFGNTYLIIILMLILGLLVFLVLCKK